MKREMLVELRKPKKVGGKELKIGTTLGRMFLESHVSVGTLWTGLTRFVLEWRKRVDGRGDVYEVVVDGSRSSISWWWCGHTEGSGFVVAIVYPAKGVDMETFVSAIVDEEVDFNPHDGGKIRAIRPALATSEENKNYTRHWGKKLT